MDNFGFVTSTIMDSQTLKNLVSHSTEYKLFKKADDSILSMELYTPTILPDNFDKNFYVFFSTNDKEKVNTVSILNNFDDAVYVFDHILRICKWNNPTIETNE